MKNLTCLSLMSPALLLSVLACDSQVGPEYLGEVLLQLRGSVEVENDSQKSLTPSLAFKTDTGYTLVHGEVEGVFPSNFQLSMMAPPPAHALKDGLAVASIVFADPNGPSNITTPTLSGSWEDSCSEQTGDEICRWTQTACAADGACAERDFECEEVECELLEAIGDPTIPTSPNTPNQSYAPEEEQTLGSSDSDAPPVVVWDTDGISADGSSQMGSGSTNSVRLDTEELDAGEPNQDRLAPEAPEFGGQAPPVLLPDGGLMEAEAEPDSGADSTFEDKLEGDSALEEAEPPLQQHSGEVCLGGICHTAMESCTNEDECYREFYRCEETTAEQAGFDSPGGMAACRMVEERGDSAIFEAGEVALASGNYLVVYLSPDAPLLDEETRPLWRNVEDLQAGYNLIEQELTESDSWVSSTLCSMDAPFKARDEYNAKHGTDYKVTDYWSMPEPVSSEIDERATELQAGCYPEFYMFNVVKDPSSASLDIQLGTPPQL